MAETEPLTEDENIDDGLKEDDEEENVPESDELSEDAQAFKEELAKISVNACTILAGREFHRTILLGPGRRSDQPYKELYNWDGAAEFVADFLNFETLEPPFELVSITITVCGL
ncbi:hypothetical protein DPMN_090449 [Dreissena polymorpha]|uniref:Uncharacterized protein n=1 Tax=Dreissena polymorpha TaxID=45954 RepID=A0A9D4QZS9_DREPO|nr:hypothetical protein DPMN_090449 [Dreissena polymorpha]